MPNPARDSVESPRLARAANLRQVEMRVGGQGKAGRENIWREG